jgi:hypothetical protein
VFADADHDRCRGAVAVAWGPVTPSPDRYRCASCGNLTRFDVVTDRRTKAFHHYSVGGELSVEDVEVISESVGEVSCRWCGHGRSIEVLDAQEAAAADAGGSPT